MTFQQCLKPMLKPSAVARWDARLVEFENNIVSHQQQWEEKYPYYVGTPGINAIAKYLAQDLKIYLNTHIKQIAAHRGGWQVSNDKGEGRLRSFYLGDYNSPARAICLLFPGDI